MKGLLIVIESDCDDLKSQIANLLAAHMNGGVGGVSRIGLPIDANARALPCFTQGAVNQAVPNQIPFTMALPECIERTIHRTFLQTLLESDYAVILDHYVSSTMIRHAILCDDEESSTQFMEWICAFEYELNGVPKPDVVFYLDSNSAPDTTRSEMRAVAGIATARENWKWIDCKDCSDESIVETLRSHVSELLKQAIMT